MTATIVRWAIPCVVVALLPVAQEGRLAVRFVPDQAEAVLALLDARANDEEAGPEPWERSIWSSDA